MQYSFPWIFWDHPRANVLVSFHRSLGGLVVDKLTWKFATDSEWGVSINSLSGLTVFGMLGPVMSPKSCWDPTVSARLRSPLSVYHQEHKVSQQTRDQARPVTVCLPHARPHAALSFSFSLYLSFAREKIYLRTRCLRRAFYKYDFITTIIYIWQENGLRFITVSCKMISSALTGES